MHEAKLAGARSVTVWGTGQARREFLLVDDLADACVFMLKNYSDMDSLNVGTGEDIGIAEFARVVAEVIGFHGELAFDTLRPGGTPRKLLDESRLTALGWRARTDLRSGLKAAYADFVAGSGRNV
jgi:GDP-L-fucose synthase